MDLGVDGSMDEVHTRDMNAQTLMDEASPSSVLSKTLNCLHHCITTRLLQCLIFFLVVLSVLILRDGILCPNLFPTSTIYT